MSTFSKIFWISFLLFIGTSAYATDHEVKVGVGGNAFSPRNVTINAGDTVTFTKTGGFHNVVADNGSFTSGAASNDPFSFTHTFATAGTFPYYCEIHGAPGGIGMAGTVTVNAVTPPFASQPITGATSGSWYDPQQSGEGFLLQVAPDNTFIAYWFVYTPDGTQQAWLVGVGAYTTGSSTVTVNAVQVVGAKFPPNFKHDDLVDTDWGTLTFTFADCTHGTASWVSKLPAYGTGSQPIFKIVGVDGVNCINE